MSETYGYDYEGAGNSLFLRLKDGDKVQVRLVSKPIQYQKEFNGKVSDKFAWVVLQRLDANTNEVKVFEQGISVYSQIKELALNPEWGDPLQYDLRISRTGAGQMDTRYTVQPSPNKRPLTKEEQTAVLEANLDLTSLLKIEDGKPTQTFGEEVPEEPVDIENVEWPEEPSEDK